jgi:hypothetical protein
MEFFTTREQFLKLLEFDRKYWETIVFGIPYYKEEHQKEDDNVKLAYVIINGKRQMIGVDNKTMKAYKLRDDIPHWKLPLEEIKYDCFERWCTTFDT